MASRTFSILETGAFLILLGLAFAGALFVGTIVHEMSHWNDYKEIVQSDSDSICLMDMPAEGWGSIMNIHGTYSYYYDTSVPGWKETAAEKDRYTEFKAYAIELILIGILFLGSTSLVLWRRMNYRREVSYQEDYVVPRGNAPNGVIISSDPLRGFKELAEA